MDVPGSSGSLSIEVGTNHGAIVVGDHNVVNLTVAATARMTLRTPAPVHRPLTPDGFLDRRAETGTLLAALGTHRVVAVEGPPRIGKSWFLQQAAEQAAARFADGALHLPPGLQGPRDVLQSLFEMFYDADPPAAPSPTRLRELLADRQALVLVDDSTLSARDTAAVLDAARGCRLLVASDMAAAPPGATTIRLGGLPIDDAMALAERVHGGPLTGEAYTTLLERCRAVEGHPQRVIDAADMLRTAPVEAGAATSSRAGHPLLEAVRAFAPHPVPRDCLPELAGLRDIDPALTTLAAQGVLEVDRDEVRLGPRAEPPSGDTRPGIDALVRLGQAARAEPSRRSRALKALPLLWLALGKSVSAQGHADVMALAQAWHVPVTLGGLWDGWHTLLESALGAARALGDHGAQAWVLHQSGTRELALGQAKEAVTLFKEALQIEQQGGHAALEAATLYHLDLIDKLGLLAAAGAGGGSLFGWATGGAAKVALGGAVLGAAVAGWMGSAPRIEVAPRQIAFSADVPGSLPPSQAVVIRNGGWRTLPAPLVTLEGADAGRFAVDSECAGHVLQRGESCRVAVRYTPTGDNAVAALSLQADSRRVTVPLTGHVRQARLVLPEQLEFGVAVVDGSAVERKAELRNTGDAPARIIGFVAPPAPFSVQLDACRGVTLAPGQTCSVTLRFDPVSVGPAEASLELRKGAETAGFELPVMRLVGSGRADGLLAEPAVVDFGTQAVGIAGTPRPVRLTNHGATPVTIGLPKVSPSFAPFRIAPGNCRDVTLDQGEGCEMQLSFTPRAGERGEQSATVRVGVSVGAPVAVAASGIGVAAQAVLAPPVLDFGSQVWPPAPTAPRLTRSVTLSNRGKAPLRVALQIGGATVADFPFRGNCPPELAPGARCTIVVDYRPHAVGASDAYLTLEAPGAEGALRLPLLGRAVSERSAVPILERPGAAVPCLNARTPVEFRWRAPMDMVAGPVQYALVIEPGGTFNVGAETRHVVELACPQALRWRVEANTVNQTPGASPWRPLSTYRTGSSAGGATGGGKFGGSSTGG